MGMPNEKINIRNAESELSPVELELCWFADLFRAVFFKDHPVPILTLIFEKTRVNNLGFYRIIQKDSGPTGHIILNRLYLDRPLWNVLTTLLHNMMHDWEYHHVAPEKCTKSWYHSKAFRTKMREFGILCNHKGSHVGFINKGKFMLTLIQHGVISKNLFMGEISAGIVPIDMTPKTKGKSKLIKWSCGCQNVRVGRAEFEATCDRCGSKFELVEK